MAGTPTNTTANTNKWSTRQLVTNGAHDRHWRTALIHRVPSASWRNLA